MSTVQNEKIVADNIELAKSKQKKIDIIKEKIVADNIELAKSKQKEIDVENQLIVADNIIIAKSKQKEIDNLKMKAINQLAGLKKELFDVLRHDDGAVTVTVFKMVRQGEPDKKIYERKFFYLWFY